jgi:hypothetical protein
MMKTPRHPWLVWVLANAPFVLLFPAISAWTYRRARAGMYMVDPATHGDSPGLLLYTMLPWLVLAVIIVNLVVFLLLRDYNGGVQVWKQYNFVGRRAALVNSLATIAMLVLLYIIGDAIAKRDWELGLIFMPWIYVVACLRAAQLSQIQGRLETS